jgi:hypothetical protein
VIPSGFGLKAILSGRTCRTLRSDPVAEAGNLANIAALGIGGLHRLPFRHPFAIDKHRSSSCEAWSSFADGGTHAAITPPNCVQLRATADPPITAKADCPIALWPAHCDDALAQYLKIWHPVETVVSYLNRWNGADDLFTGDFQRCIM